MPGQIDNRMVNMPEHQREGVGLILGSIWLWFSRLLIGSKTETARSANAGLKTPKPLQTLSEFGRYRKTGVSV